MSNAKLLTVIAGLAITAVYGAVLFRKKQIPFQTTSDVPVDVSVKPDTIETPDIQPTVVEETLQSSMDDTNRETTSTDVGVDPQWPIPEFPYGDSRLAFYQQPEYVIDNGNTYLFSEDQVEWEEFYYPFTLETSTIRYRIFFKHGINHWDFGEAKDVDGGQWITRDGKSWMKRETSEDKEPTPGTNEPPSDKLHCRLTPAEIRDNLTELSQRGVFYAKQSKRAGGSTQYSCPLNRKQRRIQTAKTRKGRRVSP